MPANEHRRFDLSGALNDVIMRLPVHMTARFTCIVCMVFFFSITKAQENDSAVNKARNFKNVVRYNLSSALLFGVDRCVVFGYERVIRPHQTISVNFGKMSLPKAVSIDTDTLHLDKDTKNSGFNVSVDYRFYLPRENKYLPPHGLYIGPYYSYNQFNRDNRWDYTTSGTNNYITSKSDFTIHTIGFELGYQFIIWKRLTLDLLMVGPGLGMYKYKATFNDNLDAASKEQLLTALDQLLKQKFPGLNYVFSDKKIDANGTLKTSTLGYRYLMQIGFNF